MHNFEIGIPATVHLTEVEIRGLAMVAPPTAAKRHFLRRRLDAEALKRWPFDREAECDAHGHLFALCNANNANGPDQGVALKTENSWHPSDCDCESAGAGDKRHGWTSVAWAVGPS